ncbi:MAG: hypothetical protein WDA03_13340 [Trueperaceae bacterium]
MPTDKQLFTIDTLGDLDDGTTRLLVDAALSEALADCDNRPYLDKPRRVVLTLELKPVLHEAGGMKGVQGDVAVKLSLPPRKTRGEYLPTNVNGDTVEAYLPFDRPNALFPQPTIPEEKN